MGRISAIALAFGLSVSGAAFGQGAAEPPADQPSQPETSVTQGSASGIANVAADAAKLSPDQKKTRGESMMGEMREALQHGTEVLREARAAKDIIQLNCVNEKLTQVKGLLKIGEKASVTMYEALASGTADVVNHEYTKLVVAHQRVMGLRAETDQCVGESTVFTGETSVEVEVSGAIDSGKDPTDSPNPPLGPEVPPVASKI